MAYRVLADAVLLLHLGFILFVIFGALLVMRRRRLLPVHLAAAAWGAGIEAIGGVCPLTHAELWLRARAGGAGYSGGFVEHYLVPLIYPGTLTRGLQFGMAAAVLLINAVLYLWIFRHRAGRPALK